MTTSVCVPTGDSRVNVYPGLGALHTIFMRYHNYVAEELAASHSDYDDEKLFQEARKIVIAVIQSITYNGNYSHKKHLLHLRTIQSYEYKSHRVGAITFCSNPRLYEVWKGRETSVMRYGALICFPRLWFS